MEGKIQVSHKEGKVLLKTDFSLRVVFDGNSTVLISLDPQYKGKVYGLCGNFNDDPQDENPVTLPGSPPIKKTEELAEAFRLVDEDLYCTGFKQKLAEVTSPAQNSEVVSSHRRQCAVLSDQNGPVGHCHGRVNPDSFYESCIVDHMHNVESNLALHQAIHSYSMVCEESSDFYSDMTACK